MSFRWRYENAAGEVVDGPDEEFADQQEAESWFGAEWPELRAAGVDAVVLLESTSGGTTELYGPMSLHEADPPD
jgi:hypothetical protein